MTIVHIIGPRQIDVFRLLSHAKLTEIATNGISSYHASRYFAIEPISVQNYKTTQGASTRHRLPGLPISRNLYPTLLVSDIAIFVLKRDVKLQLTN